MENEGSNWYHYQRWLGKLHRKGIQVDATSDEAMGFWETIEFT